MIDLRGRVFGRLLVIEKAGRMGTQLLWRCACACGEVTAVQGRSLRCGDTTSCGCFRKEQARRNRVTHGESARGRSREYRVWAGMKNRCLNKDAEEWHYYGGRGIKVCEHWLKFENFLADMGRCPDGLTLDRKDVNGNYEPSNCRWATRLVQAQNRRPQKNSTGARGVSISVHRRYVARISYRSKLIHLGSFPSLLEAVAARRQAEVDLNFGQN